MSVIEVISVNNTPLVAKALVQQLADSLSGKLNLRHIANASALDEVDVVFSSLMVVPRLLICSSQWTPAQQADVIKFGTTMFPGIGSIIIPAGLFAEKGGDAVVHYLAAESERLFA